MIPFSGHIRCYSCNKFGHVEKECRNISMNHQRHHESQTNDIIRPKKVGFTNFNVNKNKEEKIICGLALCAIKDKDEWYIDSGCSHHRIGDKSMMESLKKNQDGKVILSNDASTNIFGKGRAIINKHKRAVDTLLAQGLKQNILIV